ncbi:hypothetical protein DVH05_005629 [Phytophthora capsici]|nr:hypothetical protein DVH05_005629 [Phytophthora capsici]
MKASLVLLLLPLASTSAQSHIRCQNTIGGPCGDSSRDRAMNCCDYGYCQPWNSGIQTIYGLYPTDCCDKCTSTSGCAAYTFINENPDGKTACYLKSSTAGRTAKKGAVSAINKNYVPPTCNAKIGDSCGNAYSGPSCCPNGAFCQPWNPGYYQCVAVPDWCPTIEVGVDYYGNDLSVRKGLLPDSCCKACHDDSSCKAFTFVNKNEDGQSACYLKSGGGTPKSNAGAISGFKLIWVE